MNKMDHNTNSRLIAKALILKMFKGRKEEEAKAPSRERAKALKRYDEVVKLLGIK